jgi:hypothetical protein
MDAFGGDIIESDEHLNEVVTAMFQALLGRNPNSTDESYWGGVWKNNQGPGQIWVGVGSTENSNECYNHAQNLGYNKADANQNWINLIYEAILGHPADSGALGYFDGELSSGAMKTWDVVNAVIVSQEYYNDVVTQYYQAYLHRAPTSYEMNTVWEPQLASGLTQLQFQEDILKSTEFAGNPPAATNDAANLWTP